VNDYEFNNLFSNKVSLVEKMEKLTGFSLSPFQKRAIEAIDKDESNLIIIAPTGSGKSIIGYSALVKYGKGFYLAPLIALMNEKYSDLSKLGEKLGLSVIITNRDYRIPLSVFKKSHIKIMSPYKFLTYVSYISPKEDGKVIIVDEFHKLSGDAFFEASITLAKLLGFRIIALSATISDEDAEKLSKWLNAKIIKETHRPVELQHYHVMLTPSSIFYIASNSLMVSGKYVVKTGELFETREKAVATIASRIHIATGKPILVWAPTRHKVESLALKIAELLPKKQEFIALSEKIIASNPTEKILKQTLKSGVWIHHGGMSYTVRQFVEENYRKYGGIIVTAYTLSHGVNLPATFLIFSTIRGYDKNLLDPSSFHQISGRAGRPGYDNVGFVITVLEGNAEKEYYEKYLLPSKATEIKPILLQDEIAMIKMLLPLYYPAVKIYKDAKKGLMMYAKNTYSYMIQMDDSKLSEIIDKVINIVNEYTKYGDEKQVRVAIRMGLHPVEFKAILDMLTLPDYKSAIEVTLIAVCDLYKLDANKAYRDVMKYGYLASWIGDPVAREVADRVQMFLETASFWTARVYGWNSPEHEKMIDLAKKFAYGGNVNVEPLAKAVSIETLRRMVKAVPSLVTGVQTESEAVKLTVVATREAFLHRKTVKRGAIIKLAKLVYKALLGEEPSQEAIGKIYNLVSDELRKEGTRIT